MKAGKWSQFEVAYREVIPKVGKTEGLRGRWLVRNTEDADWGFSVRLWESAKAIAAYEADDSVQQTTRAALDPFFAREFTIRHGELSFYEELWRDPNNR